MKLKSFVLTGALAAGAVASGTATATDAMDAWLNYERPAEYEALVTQVRPVMSDGAELECTMAVPAIDGRPAPGNFPGVINNFNPYAVLGFFFVNQIEELATLGYQGLTCRVRGTGDSDGEFAVAGSQEEWRDSYELVEWLAAQPGSNGSIAFEGASYGGMTALQAAIGKPPHLVTVIPLVPASDLYLDFIYRGGIKSRPYTTGNWALVTSLMTFPSMSPWRVWEQWYAHPDLDAFWQDSMPIHRAETIDVPMLIAPGWADDVLPNGGIRLFETMQRSGKADQAWMFVGAWDHEMAVFPRNVVIAWLDHWLQARVDAPLPPARVVSYEMGAGGVHRTFDQWPPAGSDSLSFALNKDGSLADTAGAAGTLSFEQSAYSGLVGRPDTLTFATPILDEDLVIAGDMALELVAAYDGVEATLHARLLEEREGEATLIKEGWLNVAHRESHSTPTPIPSGEIVTATVDIGAMHRRVPAGSKLVLEISGVDTWDWQTVSSPVTAAVATGEGGSRLRLQVLNPSSEPPVSAVSGQGLPCDDSIKQAFKPDELTTVLHVEAFSSGEKLVLGDDNPALAPVAEHDLCLVKLNVGPGNPGPEGAPSASRGIGIEVWLPSPGRWNERIHALGGGGWQGGVAGSPEHVANPYAAMVASREGAVSSSTDTGHASEVKSYGIPEDNGDFAMNPDGSPNEALWRDFSVRAIHQQAVKTKALTQAFYGRPARYSYWDGSSTGGRQGHKLAQAHPEDFDGIVANMPALHWTRMLKAIAYPHIVYQRDLGGEPLTTEQLDAVSRAAIHACDVVGGVHLGYLMDPSQCTYDPTEDPAVLCQADGGANDSATCVTRKQARVINKIWYGPTRDGSVPDPAQDNGWNTPAEGNHLWYGPARGTSLWNAFFTTMLGRPSGVANPDSANFLGTDQIALSLQDPSLSTPAFRNGRSDGRDGWKSLSYKQLAEAFDRGVELNQTVFGGINTDEPDLSGLEKAGGKLLGWHGTNDEVIPVQGTMQYYDSVVETMGSLERVQAFYRFYIVPGAGHHSPNGTANPAANPPIFAPSKLYELLVDWVENDIGPGRVDIHSPSDKPVNRSQPVCVYPETARYTEGDPNVASSYFCAD